MPRTIEKTIYQFSELSDEAKEKAREWFKSTADFSDLDNVISDFCSIADILGLELSTYPVRLMNGKTRNDPALYYSVGYSQSDYAAFTGTWKYKKGAAKAIREYAPVDKVLHAIVDDWQALNKRHFYRLRAICSENRGNQYVNEVLQGYSSRYDEEAVNLETEREAENLVDRLASWLYDSLRAECDYQSSDEYVDENIACNGYEFDENGNIQ